MSGAPAGDGRRLKREMRGERGEGDESRYIPPDGGPLEIDTLSGWGDDGRIKTRHGRGGGPTECSPGTGAARSCCSLPSPVSRLPGIQPSLQTSSRAPPCLSIQHLSDEQWRRVGATLTRPPCVRSGALTRLHHFTLLSSQQPGRRFRLSRTSPGRGAGGSSGPLRGAAGCCWPAAAS